jgi:hypothetical protein
MSSGPTAEVEWVRPDMKRTGRPLHPARAVAAALLALAAGCASVDFKRDTETSGTFESSARSFTFLGWEIPRPALVAALENASDSRLPQLVITEQRTTDWGWWDWLLEIISSRSATVRGTWGDPG